MLKYSLWNEDIAQRIKRKEEFLNSNSTTYKAEYRLKSAILKRERS
jgi:hypothetical protein